MRIRFTKMQGAGNDFVVLDETRARLKLNTAQYRFLADRHFGVGADQILTVRPAPNDSLDFEYVIHNADGGEVEHCGNGARCFVRYVRDKGLTTKDLIRVKVQQGEIELQMNADGRVTVNMGGPVLDLPKVPFNSEGLAHNLVNGCEVWHLPLNTHHLTKGETAHANVAAFANVAVVSMGNPHAVQVVSNVDTAPVSTDGPMIENHSAFPNRVNAGFMQILSRDAIRLRVFERGSGETLACGTGACAAVVVGIRMGLLNPKVDVHTHGGLLTIEWQGAALNDVPQPVWMTGPATSVFEGEIDVPELP
jgi:diaminopimelate epimerase